MKMPFGFGRKNVKKGTRREFFEEEFIEDDYIEEEYYEEDYVEDEYLEEYSEEDYVEDEYSEDYSEEEYMEDEYYEEDYEEDYTLEEEISYEEEETFTVPIGQYEDELYDAEEVYEDEDIYEDDEDGAGILSFGNVSGIVDKLITFGGVAVLLIGLIIGGIFICSRMNVQEEDTFLNVGNQLARIDVIGGSGLLAVSDAQKAAMEAAKIVEEEEEESYEEEEYNTEVTVKLSMASIEKDLKIKFVNQETGKLVGNVPFSIKVTSPNGKEMFWSDDDMDGIIYKKKLDAGQYKVSVNAFEEEKYKKYGLPTGTLKVDVKAEIEYKKVDVANEVKSESQVDVKKEDTKIKETVVESYLTDTVTWVESTATLVAYTEVAKENIVDPMQLVMNNVFVKLAASGGDVLVSPSPEASESPGPSPSPEVSGSPGPSPSPEVSGSPSPSPIPTIEPIEITLDKKTATVYVDDVNGEAVKINVTVKPEQEDALISITAASSDTNVLKIKEVKDKIITLEGIAEGTATVEVTCKAELKVMVPAEEGEGTVEKTLTADAQVQSCTVVVKRNPKKDTATVLKDNLEREVYVLENNTYRTAHYADYYTFSKFYVKGEAKYTGWQTLNGKRYFYDTSGKKVTGEQVIQGVKYNFASDGSLVTGSGTLGIDVSKWNGNIDWTAVKNSGVSYVIIRCGYRGSSAGALIKDSKFETNIKEAINAGLKVGVYFFSQAIDKNEAVEEASMVLECVKNYKISYPIFLDVEPSGGRADSISAATRTEVCKAFCETIQSYGYTAGIYANKTWLTEKINTSELSGNYKIWLAQYAAEPTYTGRYDMWQYKDTGKIKGISGDVDMNLSYLGY